MHNHLRILVVAFLGAAAFTPAARAQDAPQRSAVAARVDSLARAFVADRDAPAVSVEVVRGGDTVVSAGYGTADLENQVPATAATLYRIGSITKQFTAAAVIRLVEQGKVTLDDSIAAYVPNLPAAWRAVTVRELLNHTSGVPSYTDIGERWARRWGDPMPPDTLVALTANTPMWFKPGTNWRYDNSGYVVLGMLLDHVTGVPYPKFIETGLLRPLGLEHTYYCDTHRVLPHRASGYAPTSDGWGNAAYLDMTQPYAAGALCSTVGDLARWNILLAHGKVVSAASYHAMTTPTGAAKAHHYGFGLIAGSLSGHAMIAHEGGIPGFITSTAYFPADSLSITVLANSGSAPSDPLLANIARAALGVSLEQPPARVALTAAERQRYAGSYVLHMPNGKTLPITITAGKAALMAQGIGESPFELVPIGDDAFRAQFDPTLRMTFTLEGGKATGYTIVQHGATMHATRIGDEQR
ncbi:MAG TPA: serine hydrolase domain-containing protein [Burkholderiales bacterium]|nr:serine hydrolase domain-containing protein [Burkholderiales bacterium]